MTCLNGAQCNDVVSQGNTVELPEEENTPEKRVDRIFAMMDKVSVLMSDWFDQVYTNTEVHLSSDQTFCSTSTVDWRR